MAKMTNRLTDAAIRGALKQGMHADGDGLYLQVTGTAKSWLYRYMTQGRQRYLGLGPYPAVGLAAARMARDTAKHNIAAGADPIEQRRAARTPKPTAVTFRQAVAEYLAAHEASWRNPKHRQQWRNTLDTYAAPLMDKPVEAITTPDVKAVLTAKVETRHGSGALWDTLPETADRLRGRIESVISAYNATYHRDVLNPARWPNHLQHILPKRDVKTQHHAALPWKDVPALMARLADLSGSGALALRFTILTAARTGETIGAPWSEIDWDERLWTVPAERMKAKRDHEVPLSDAALDVLRQALETRTSDAPDAPIFPGMREGQGISNMTMMKVLAREGRGDLTVHGFRSAFRDWVADATTHQREVAEAALAHKLGDKTEQAYARSTMLAKRRALMDDWAAFCTRPANVVPLRPSAASA